MALNTSDVPLRLPAAAIVSWQSDILQIACDCVFYGIQVAVFVAAMAASVRRDRPGRLIMVVIVALFLSSTIVVLVDMTRGILQSPAVKRRGLPLSEAELHGIDYTMQVCTRINLLVSDAIVVWRAWILSQGRQAAKCALLVCMSGSCAGVIAECVWWAQDMEVNKGVMARTLMMDLPLLSTNVVATILVAMQIWTYRRDIKVHIGPWKKKTRVERALILLLESGFAYCIIWVASIAIDLVMGTGNLYVYRAIGISYHSIAGIYPTLIALVVALQRSAASSVLLSTQVSRPMVFAEGAGEQVSEAARKSEQEAQDSATNFDISPAQSAQANFHIEDKQSIGQVTDIAQSSAFRGNDYRG